VLRSRVVAGCLPESRCTWPRSRFLQNRLTIDCSMDSNPAFGRILNRIHLDHYSQNLVHDIVWQPAMRVNLRARLTRKSPGPNGTLYTTDAAVTVQDGAAIDCLEHQPIQLPSSRVGAMCPGMRVEYTTFSIGGLHV